MKLTGAHVHEGDKTWHMLLRPPGTLGHYQLQLAAMTHGPESTALGKLEPRPLTVMGTCLIATWLFLKTFETSEMKCTNILSFTNIRLLGKKSTMSTYYVPDTLPDILVRK